ncbi:MAG: methylenetetrahydrofolate reductase [Pirellulaceae bacterium]|nr:MAG: methylenetetrahydrofolate reductase [Pirellulaceae bacterium]
MKLGVFYENRVGLSFELFPPKTVQGEQSLFENLEELMAFQPDFVTCTYGAGGSTRTKTLEIVTEVKKRFGVPVASHLTCVGSSVDQLRDYLENAARRQVDAIVALRGDPPRGESSFRPVPDGLRYANELVALIRREYPGFGIAVAGYPEKHLEAPSFEVDLANLKRKVEAGADVVITQLFYRNTDFFRFVERCRQIGIQVPIVPGILPITSLSQIQRITSLCGATLPEPLAEKLARHDDPQWQFQVGVEHAIQQVRELLEQGVAGLHFYVLNRSPATSAVLTAVGWAGRPAAHPGQNR